MFEKLKTQIIARKSLIEGVSSTVIMIGLLFSAAPLVPSILIALGGLGLMLSQLVDADEDKAMIVSVGLMLSSLLIKHLLGTAACVLVVVAAFGLAAYAGYKEAQK